MRRSWRFDSFCDDCFCASLTVAEADPPASFSISLTALANISFKFIFPSISIEVFMWVSKFILESIKSIASMIVDNIPLFRLRYGVIVSASSGEIAPMFSISSFSVVDDLTFSISSRRRRKSPTLAVGIDIAEIDPSRSG
jgi:hypothetical protein